MVNVLYLLEVCECTLGMSMQNFSTRISRHVIHNFLRLATCHQYGH